MSDDSTSELIELLTEISLLDMDSLPSCESEAPSTPELIDLLTEMGLIDMDSLPSCELETPDFMDDMSPCCEGDPDVYCVVCNYSEH